MDDKCRANSMFFWCKVHGNDVPTTLIWWAPCCFLLLGRLTSWGKINMHFFASQFSYQFEGETLDQFQLHCVIVCSLSFSWSIFDDFKGAVPFFGETWTSKPGVFFPRASERRVSSNSGGLYLIFSPSHLHTFSHTFSSSHLLIFTSAHLHICSSSHLLIFTSAPLHIFSSSHLLIFTSSHLHICSSSHLLIFTSAHLHICSSSHLLIFTSSHLHICSSSHLLIFTSAHLHICSSSHLLLFTSSHLHIFTYLHLLSFSLSLLFPLSFLSLLSLSLFSLSLSRLLYLSLFRPGGGAGGESRNVNPFARNEDRSSKTEVKIAIFTCAGLVLEQPFRTKMRVDRQKTAVKIAIFYLSRSNLFARNEGSMRKKLR